MSSYAVSSQRIMWPLTLHAKRCSTRKIVEGEGNSDPCGNRNMWIIMSILSSISHYIVTYLTQTLLRLVDVWATTAYVIHCSSCCEVDLLDSNLDLLFQRCHYTIQLCVTWLLIVSFRVISETAYVILMAGILEKRSLPSGCEMGPNQQNKTPIKKIANIVISV